MTPEQSFRDFLLHRRQAAFLIRQFDQQERSIRLFTESQKAFRGHGQQENEQRFRNDFAVQSVMQNGRSEISFLQRPDLVRGGNLVLFQALPCGRVIGQNEQESDEGRH